MKNKNYFKKVAKPQSREAYLSHTRFKIGPAPMGHSEYVGVAYYTDGTSIKFYSKDCKNLMDFPKNWDANRYGLPYLRKLYLNGGTEHHKIDKLRLNFFGIYRANDESKQAIEVLYRRFDPKPVKPTTPSVEIPKSKFYLRIGKAAHQMNNDQDKFFTIFSDNAYTESGELDIHQTLESLYLKFRKLDPKGEKTINTPMVFLMETRQRYADMSRNNGTFYEPFSNVVKFSFSMNTPQN
jgi:hypothetical protein